MAQMACSCEAGLVSAVGGVSCSAVGSFRLGGSLRSFTGSTCPGSDSIIRLCIPTSNFGSLPHRIAHRNTPKHARRLGRQNINPLKLINYRWGAEGNWFVRFIYDGVRDRTAGQAGKHRLGRDDLLLFFEI